MVMNSAQIELSIKDALERGENYTPEFKKVLENRLEQLESKGFQERMQTVKK